MSKKLILDLGNTLSKAACLENSEFTTVERFTDDNLLIRWLEVRPDFDSAIIGAVRPLPDEIASWARLHPPVCVC